MTTCPTCLRTLSVCDACGAPLAAVDSLSVWRESKHTRRSSLDTRQHRHYHARCAPPEEPARPPPAPARQRSHLTPIQQHSTHDHCDVCGKTLLVTELAYRTVRIGGKDIGRAGHPDCLNAAPARVEPPVTEGDRRRPKSNRSRGT